MELEERFWSKVDWDLRNPIRCWPWTASLMWRGYGQFGFKDINGKHCVGRAHRMAYEMFFGETPSGLHVDHLCHQPPGCKAGEECPHRKCCNPFHMTLVTNSQNHAAGRIGRGMWKRELP